MNSSHFLFIVAVTLGSNLIVLAEEEPKQYRLTDPINRCSNHLSQMISNFCNNKYKIVKRDTRTSLIIEKLIPEDLHEHIKRERWRRLRRQVADECCTRPCKVSHILLYCPVDAQVVKERPEIFY